MKRRFFIILIIEIVFQWCFINRGYSQADAGEDKFYLSGGSGVIIGGPSEDLWCYSWEPTTGLSDPKSPNPLASPATTTTYKVRVVGENFSFTDEDEVTVYVINGLEIEIEDNLTECMEERELTYTATIQSDAPIPFELTDDIEYIFHYEKADGSSFTANESSNNTVFENTVKADKVPDGDNDHKYNTPAYAEIKYLDGTLTSNTINIDVYELWIEYARYANDPTKEWKTIVGKIMDYKAIASSDCGNWEWDMEDGVPDVWNPETVREKTGWLTIPLEDLENAKNSYFGDAYGTLTVSCTDGDGNTYTLKSTDMVPSQKIKVFYDPHTNIDGDPPSNEKPPCWFIFWKDGNVIDGISDWEYDNSEQWGAYNPNTGRLCFGPLAADANSGTETLKDLNGNVFSMTGSGKHLKCAAETMSHELYHKLVHDSLMIITPSSDDDELPDADENFPHRTYFKRSLPNNTDSFNWINDPSNDYYSYADQEVRCRIIEISPGLQKTYPEKDWSADAENPEW